MSIVKMSISIPPSPQSLCFSSSFSAQCPFLPWSKFTQLAIHGPGAPTQTTTIRMGGGPRTFPGGVSKWQWKRMQAKKAKQLLKARLDRERRIYEMRKRAELRAAISELERPWEAVKKPPTLFSISADEQLKVLADRFQKPGGLDLWSDKDGPQLFETPSLNSSRRFFPKGAIPIVKPSVMINSAGRREQLSLPDDLSKGGNGAIDAEENNGGGGWKGYRSWFGRRKNRGKFERSAPNGLKQLHSGQNHGTGSAMVTERNGRGIWRRNDDDLGRYRSRRDVKTTGSNDIKRLDLGQIGYDSDSKRTPEWFGGINDSLKSSESDAEVYDMTLQEDGRYEF